MASTGESTNSLEKEWSCFEADMMATGTGWQMKKDSEYSISCIHLTDYSFNGQRALTELVFQKTEEKVAITIKYDERIIQIDGIEDQMQTMTLVEKASFLVQLLTKTAVCTGIPKPTTTDCDLLPNNARCVLVKQLTNPDSVEEERVFSIQCHIFTNSGGNCCPSCKSLQYNFAKKKKRREGCCGVTKPGCNHRYMTKNDLVMKIMKDKMARLKERKEREKLEAQMLEMDEIDHQDMSKLFQSVNKHDIPEDMLVLWQQQLDVTKKTSSNGYRWHPRIMKLCIELYSKNPHVLDPLRKLLYLPSNRTIRYHKNKTDQKPGWNRDMLHWCLREANAKNLKEQDFWGGFVLDEMKIQKNVEMVIKNGKHRLVGFVDLGEIHDDMETLSGKSQQPQLASHVLQFIFLGDNGFRFPIAQFPSGGCSASDIFFIFWDGVRMMYETGFHIYWCILDGAEVNRQFIKIHFKDEEQAVDHKFVAHNLYTGDPMVFLMDPKVKA